MKKSCYLAINDQCSPSYRNQSIESIDWLLYDEVHWSLMGEALRFFAIPNGLTHYYTVLKDLDFLTVIPLQWKQNTCQISNTYRILEYIYKIAELKKKKKQHLSKNAGLQVTVSRLVPLEIAEFHLNSCLESICEKLIL